MEMHSEKTFKTACTLYKQTSVSVTVTLEISSTVCKTSSKKCRVKRHLQLPVHCIRWLVLNNEALEISCTVCNTFLWKSRVKRHLQVNIHRIS